MKPSFKSKKKIHGKISFYFTNTISNRFKNELKTTAKKLNWASTKICSLVNRSTLGGDGCFKELYEAMKDTQNLLTELWDKSFSQEVIEYNLEVDMIEWDRAMLQLIFFLKTHKIQNDIISRLVEESNLPSNLQRSLKKI